MHRFQTLCDAYVLKYSIHTVDSKVFTLRIQKCKYTHNCWKAHQHNTNAHYTCRFCSTINIHILRQRTAAVNFSNMSSVCVRVCVYCRVRQINVPFSGPCLSKIIRKNPNNFTDLHCKGFKHCFPCLFNEP